MERSTRPQLAGAGRRWGTAADTTRVVPVPPQAAAPGRRARPLLRTFTPARAMQVLAAAAHMSASTSPGRISPEMLYRIWGRGSGMGARWCTWDEGVVGGHAAATRRQAPQRTGPRPPRRVAPPLQAELHCSMHRPPSADAARAAHLPLLRRPLALGGARAPQLLQQPRRPHVCRHIGADAGVAQRQLGVLVDGPQQVGPCLGAAVVAAGAVGAAAGRDRGERRERRPARRRGAGARGRLQGRALGGRIGREGLGGSHVDWEWWGEEEHSGARGEGGLLGQRGAARGGGAKQGARCRQRRGGAKCSTAATGRAAHGDTKAAAKRRGEGRRAGPVGVVQARGKGSHKRGSSSWNLGPSQDTLGAWPGPSTPPPCRGAASPTHPPTNSADWRARRSAAVASTLVRDRGRGGCLSTILGRRRRRRARPLPYDPRAPPGCAFECSQPCDSLTLV